MEETPSKVLVKWSGREIDIEYGPNDTISDLKNSIYFQTKVKPERQKLLNLKFKGTFN